MFTPAIDLNVVYRCSYFRLTDETGPDTGDGTKWDGVAGLVSSNVTEALITVIDPNGTETDLDVTTKITDASPITGDVALGDHGGDYIDGLYNLVYKIKTGTFGISAFADYNATVSGTTKVVASNHGLVTGEYVIITATSNYNGTYQITTIDGNNFYIFVSFVATETGTGTRYYLTTFYPYVYCTLEAKRDRMYANISRMAPGDTRDKWITDADRVNALLMVIKSAISSANTTALANIQAEADQITSFYDIDATF